jgi:hypothetical protein
MADSAEYTWLHSQEQILGRLASPFTNGLPNAPVYAHADVQDKPASQDGQDWLIRAYREHNATIPPVATSKEEAIAYLSRIVDLAQEAASFPESNANDPERSDLAYAKRVRGWIDVLSPAAGAVKAAGGTTEQVVSAAAVETTSKTTLYAAIAGGVAFLGIMFLLWKKKKRKRAAAAVKPAPVPVAVPALAPPAAAAAAAAGLGCLCGFKESKEVVLEIRRLENLVKQHPELPTLKQLLASLKKAVKYRGPRRPHQRTFGRLRRGRR